MTINLGSFHVFIGRCLLFYLKVKHAFLLLEQEPIIRRNGVERWLWMSVDQNILLGSLPFFMKVLRVEGIAVNVPLDWKSLQFDTLLLLHFLNQCSAPLLMNSSDQKIAIC